jgi:hypothetical protein
MKGVELKVVLTNVVFPEMSWEIFKWFMLYWNVYIKVHLTLETKWYFQIISWEAVVFRCAVDLRNILLIYFGII